MQGYYVWIDIIALEQVCSSVRSIALILGMLHCEHCFQKCLEVHQHVQWQHHGQQLHGR
jgi:hypothetical protein